MKAKSENYSVDQHSRLDIRIMGDKLASSSAATSSTLTRSRKIGLHSGWQFRCLDGGLKHGEWMDVKKIPSTVQQDLVDQDK